MAALDNFLKQNVSGPVNKVFLAGYIRDISTADNKWKAVLKTLVEMAFWTSKILAPLRYAAFSAAAILGFNKIGDAIRGVVRDTGSLDAALRRIQSIQQIQRQFAPLLGGLNAAKQRVAELVTLSARGPFKFEEVAQASRSLEVYTRGAYSGVDATREIGKASIATGNNITESADAVGSFYQTLREGAPIDSAAEKLRQMGLISQQTADQLSAMAAGGSTNAQVFTELTAALATTGEGFRGFQGELAAVTAEHEKAAEELKRQFGAPFTRDAVENTKNMTAAMQAIAPTIGSVSGFLRNLFNGFSTVTTATLKYVAQNSFLRGSLEFVAKAIGITLAAAAALGTVFLATLVPATLRLVPGLYALGGAATAAAVGLRVLAAASVIGLIIMGLVALGGAIVNFVQSSQQQRKELAEMTRAHREAQAAVDAHIASVETLADRHEALAEATQKLIDLQNELNDLYTKGAPTEQVEEKMRAITEAERKLRQAALAPTRGLGGPEAAATQQMAAQRRLQKEQSDFERDLAGHPERREELTRAREQTLRERAAAARTGLAARQAVAETRTRLEQQKAPIEEEMKRMESVLPSYTNQKDVDALKSKIAIRRDRLNQLDAQILEAGKGFGTSATSSIAGTSIFLETQAQQIQHALNARTAQIQGDRERVKREQQLAGQQAVEYVKSVTPEQAAGAVGKLRVAARIQARRETEATQIEERADQMRAERQARAREAQIARTQEDIELGAHQARRRGDTLRSDQLEDELDFAKQYQQNVEIYGEGEEAKQRAIKKVQDDILETANARGLPQVASSLARIGGGGGVYAPGGDPMVRIAERQRTLLESIRDYLREIANKDGKMGVE